MARQAPVSCYGLCSTLGARSTPCFTGSSASSLPSASNGGHGNRRERGHRSQVWRLVLRREDCMVGPPSTGDGFGSPPTGSSPLRPDLAPPAQAQSGSWQGPDSRLQGRPRSTSPPCFLLWRAVGRHQAPTPPEPTTMAFCWTSWSHTRVCGRGCGEQWEKSLPGFMPAGNGCTAGDSFLAGGFVATLPLAGLCQRPTTV